MGLRRGQELEWNGPACAGRTGTKLSRPRPKRPRVSRPTNTPRAVVLPTQTVVDSSAHQFARCSEPSSAALRGAQGTGGRSQSLRLRSARGLGDRGNPRESLSVAGLVAARTGGAREPALGVLRAPGGRSGRRRRPLGAAPARHPDGGRRSGARDPDGRRSSRQPGVRRAAVCDLDVHCGRPVRRRRLLPRRLRALLRRAAARKPGRLPASAPDRRLRARPARCLVAGDPSPSGSRSTGATPSGREAPTRVRGRRSSSGSSSRSRRGRSCSSRSACGSSTAGAGRVRSARSSPRSRC